MQPTFLLWHLRLWWDRRRGRDQVPEVLLVDTTGRSGISTHPKQPPPSKKHSPSRRHCYVVLVGHDELLNSLLPLLEHLGAPVVEQGELLQHHVLGRLDLGAQVEFGGLRV